MDVDQSALPRCVPGTQGRCSRDVKDGSVLPVEPLQGTARPNVVWQQSSGAGHVAQRIVTPVERGQLRIEAAVERPDPRPASPVAGGIVGPVENDQSGNQ